MAARKEPVKPTTNLQAAESGDYRTQLEVLVRTLARSMDECDANMHAQLAGQYRAALADLAKVPATAKVSKADELAARRKARSA